MSGHKRSSTDLVIQLVDNYLGNLGSEDDKLAALRFAKHELNSRKNDEKQDPRAILYSLQRRFYALGQNEVAMRLTEGADRITFPGPTLSLLGHLHGSEQDLPNRPIEPTEATPTSRLNPKVSELRRGGQGYSARGQTSDAHKRENDEHDSGRIPVVSGRQTSNGEEERTATLMVREVLYACQAVNGKFLTLPDNEEGLAQISPNLKIRKPERQLMLKLSELGWLFRKLRSHTEVSAIPDGPVRQAFMGALRQELSDFYRLLATLEAQANIPLPGKENQDPQGESYLTLRRLTVWLGEPLVRIRWLAGVADWVAPCSGGQLLAALEAAQAHGQPLIRSALTRCLRLSAVPFLSQLWSWIFQGKLATTDESMQEFFITSNRHNIDGNEHGLLWREGYTIFEKMRPPSISEDLAQEILRAGKSLNFLRECCGDTEWAQHSNRTLIATSASKLQYDQMKAVSEVVRKATSDIDKHVVQKLLSAFQLGPHCEAIKRYLLLGQGDFIEALMDNVGKELSRPARDISEFSLNASLDAALRASSAQYDPPDQVNRLRIKLENSQTNDEGWDVFTLKYTIEEPVATILNNSAMKAYLQLFKLAWALKRSEHSLNECWVDLNAVQRQLSAFPGYVKKTGAESYSMEKVWEDLRMCHRLRNEMAQLVGSLQSYMMLEVIESAWTDFMHQLKTTTDLDGLIGAHEEYLKTLQKKLFLENPTKRGSTPGVKSPDVQLELRKLLKVTLELRARIASLAEVVGSACSKARMYIQNALILEARGEWGRHEGSHPILGVPPLELERVHYGLQKLDSIYGEQLISFLSLLPSAAHLDLRLLLFRLEAGGQGRYTEDGSRGRITEDGSNFPRKLSVA